MSDIFEERGALARRFLALADAGMLGELTPADISMIAYLLGLVMGLESRISDLEARLSQLGEVKNGRT